MRSNITPYPFVHGNSFLTFLEYCIMRVDVPLLSIVPYCYLIRTATQKKGLYGPMSRNHPKILWKNKNMIGSTENILLIYN